MTQDASSPARGPSIAASMSRSGSGSETGTHTEHQQILVSTDGPVLTITLNRPEQLNAWTPRMQSEFLSVITAADAEPAVRAIIITGAGRGFCAGADMSILDTVSGGERSDELVPDALSYGVNARHPAYEWPFTYLLSLGTPLIAAINGPVAGIGLCLATFCDFRFMADGNKLTTAFARRGLIAEYGLAWVLPRLIGVPAALDLLLTGRTVTTDEAAHLGLVTACPADGLMARVNDFARDLATMSSPRSVSVIKRQLWDGLWQDPGTALEIADREMALSMDCEDFREGVAHFTEKRAPRFTGR